jgi:hypothetical protein
VSTLILKRAAASRPSGKWDDDDFDVLADGVVVGRIMKAAASPVGMRRRARYWSVLKFCDDPCADEPAFRVATIHRDIVRED